MARLRKFVAYRNLERPYTRVSKYRDKSFVKTRPHSKIVKFDMGNTKKQYDYVLELITNQTLQIRHNAIEAARLSSNKLLEKKVGKSNYWMRIRIYPHHILRENPLASGAGADRMSTGMKHSFGKPIGVAAQIRKPGKVICELRVNKEHLELARKALKRFGYKLPCKTSIIVKKQEESKTEVQENEEKDREQITQRDTKNTETIAKQVS